VAKVKTRKRNKAGSRGKGLVRRLPRARKIRKKRKIARISAARAAALRPVEDYESPGIRNVEVRPAASASLPCSCRSGCVAVTTVTWEHWHRGHWRAATRNLCRRRTERLRSRLRRAG
jgi:hypothetical protein